MDKSELTAALKTTASELGFALAGACPAVTPAGWSKLLSWLQCGYAGEMRFLAERAAAYEHPGSILAGARSLLMLGMNYRSAEPEGVQAGEGRVSRYAWGAADYHDVLHARLKRLVQRLNELQPSARARGVVDTAPLLEREFAQLAGLGWIGKNTLLLNRRLGSWLFLAALVTDEELAYDAPHATDHCGTCRACLDACPTQAFVEPYVLDATRCISYLTIEHRGPIAEPLRPALGDWILGCDICQEVCPWNRRPAAGHNPEFVPEPATNPLALAGLFFLSDEQFRSRFRHTPLWRPKRRGMLRNAAIVLGNQLASTASAALLRGLADDEPLVREASAWALSRVGDSAFRQPLIQALSRESDPTARQGITLALQAIPG